MTSTKNILNGGLASPKITTRKLTLMGIVIAGRIVLSFIPAVNIGNVIEFGVGFVGTALSGILFGPLYAMIVSILNDLLTYFISGGGYFFIGFTLSAGVAGWIYGKLLWRQPFSWRRTFIAVLLVTLIVNIGMNSLWVKMMFDQAWNVFMPLRVAKNLVSLPVNTLILGLLFKNESVRRLIDNYQF